MVLGNAAFFAAVFLFPVTVLCSAGTAHCHPLLWGCGGQGETWPSGAAPLLLEAG